MSLARFPWVSLAEIAILWRSGAVALTKPVSEANNAMPLEMAVSLMMMDLH